MSAGIARNQLDGLTWAARTICGTAVGLALVTALATACGGSQKPDGQESLDADPPQTAGEQPNPGADQSDLKTGIAAIKAEKYDEAKAAFEKAVAANPKSAETHFYLAVAREKTGDKKGAEEAYKKSLAIDGNSIDAVQNLSALYLDEPARPDEAIQVLKQGLGKSPDSAGLHQNLAFAYSLKGDSPNAAKHFETAIAKGDSVELRLAYGDFLLKQKQHDKAAEHLRKALGGAKDDAAMIGTLGTLLAYAHAYGDCVKALDRALKLKPDQPDFLVRRGTCRHELKDEAGARADYQAAIKADGKFAAAHYYLGLSLLDEKKNKEAAAELDLAAKHGEGTPLGKAAAEKLASIKGPAGKGPAGKKK
jgi:tetratricopeptide (TPR) repeat protein